MKLFNRAFMNGATLFGVSLTLSALAFAISDNLGVSGTITFFLIAYLYLIASVLAFMIPSLSE
ncbi:hypothetical protein KAT80_02660 [Candidatus Pacearchaeota archaeon]|nr:hypothetical protein [Candidatus Pacearchaeota archaeon]